MKKYLIPLFITTLFLAVTVPAFAKNPNNHSRMSRQAGKSNIFQAYLTGDNWKSWAKMTYNRSGDTLKFVLNAHKVERGEKYELKVGDVKLGEGTANNGGQLHIMGSWDCNKDLHDKRIELKVKDGDDWKTVLKTGEFDVFDCED